MKPTKGLMLNCLRGLYVGTHSQSDAVHKDYENENAELECTFKWCWPTYQAIRRLIEKYGDEEDKS